MAGLAWKKQIVQLLSKYKYVLLILCIGILMMTFPGTGKDPEPVEVKNIPEPTLTAEKELEMILTQIDGVGKVNVMISELAGAETVYQTNEDGSESDGSKSIRTETVIVSEGNREQGLVRTVTPPVYLGAVVVCQGGGEAAVRLAVVQAVSAVLGIGSDRITVLKMK